jgi:serine/threonine protein kinase
LQVFLAAEHLAIVLEYVDGMNLLQYVNDHGPLPEIEARSLLHDLIRNLRHNRLLNQQTAFVRALQSSVCRWFFQQLIAALDYLHCMGVAHRDVKIENILLNTSPRPLLKICDLGFSKHSEYQSSPKSMIGTLNYTAPEVLQSGSYDGKVMFYLAEQCYFSQVRHPQ